MTLEYVWSFRHALVVALAGARVLRKGERQMVSPQLVDVSYEVGDGLCWDNLCLVRWVGVRHAVGPSGARERPGTETREGPRAKGGDRSYPVAGHRVVTNTVRVWGAPGSWRCHVIGRRQESRIVGNGRIWEMMVQERGRIAGETM
jgi:hypothetical protein